MTIGNLDTKHANSTKPYAQFKERIFKRADRDGVARAAQDLGITESLLADWREHDRIQQELSDLTNQADYLIGARF